MDYRGRLIHLFMWSTFVYVMFPNSVIFFYILSESKDRASQKPAERSTQKLPRYLQQNFKRLIHHFCWIPLVNNWLRPFRFKSWEGKPDPWYKSVNPENLLISRKTFYHTGIYKLAFLLYPLPSPKFAVQYRPTCQYMFQDITISSPSVLAAVRVTPSHNVSGILASSLMHSIKTILWQSKESFRLLF